MYKFTKANLFNEHLIDTDMRKGFNVVEDEQCIIFYLEPNINGSKCEVMIGISDAYDVDVMYTFARLSNMTKQDSIIRVLNELNRTYKMKYTLSDNGNIQATFEYLSTVDEFNPDVLLNYVVARFKHIEEDAYPKIMRTMWN